MYWFWYLLAMVGVAWAGYHGYTLIAGFIVALWFAARFPIPTKEQKRDMGPASLPYYNALHLAKLFQNPRIDRDTGLFCLTPETAKDVGEQMQAIAEHVRRLEDK